MSVFLAQQMRQYSLLFRIFTDFTLSTQKTEKSTGEKVAVLKDFGTSPYVLTGDEFDKYGISSIQRCTAEIGNYDLFCLNTGADGGSTEARRHEIKVMESLFPNPCPYEK